MHGRKNLFQRSMCFGWMLIPGQLRNCRKRKMHKRENTQRKKTNLQKPVQRCTFDIYIYMCVYASICVCVVVGERANKMYTENHITAHWSRCILVLSDHRLCLLRRNGQIKWMAAKTWRRGEVKREHVYKMIVKDAVFAFHVYATNRNLFMWDVFFSLSASFSLFVRLRCSPFVRACKIPPKY